MGIPSLETFHKNEVLSQNKKAYQEINILEKIKEFQKVKKRTPVILFDYKSYNQQPYHSSPDSIFGGRYQQLRKKQLNFLQNLRDAGAKLVFMKMGPPANDVEWSYLQQKRYLQYIEILEKVENGATVAQMVEELGGGFPTTSVFFKELVEILSPTDQIIHAVHNPMNLEMANYANKNKVLAIFADDSDFFIYGGDWRYWSSRSIDYVNCTTMDFDRDQLRNHLDLYLDQMPIFATYAGNKLVDAETLNDFHQKLGPFSNKFGNIAKYIKDAKFPSKLTSNSLKKISVDIYGNCWPENIENVQKSLDFYNIRSAKLHQETDELLRLAAESANDMIYAVLDRKKLYFSPIFYDFRQNDVMAYFEIIEAVVQKSCGILLQHKNDDSVRITVFTKRVHDSYTEEELVPEYPDVKIPPLIDFLFKKTEIDEYERIRYELLPWIFSDEQINAKFLNSIEKDYAIPAITCNLLVKFQSGAISVMEADLLLLATHDLREEIVPDLQDLVHLNADVIRLAHLYKMVYYQIVNAMKLMGLDKYVSILHFDGMFLHFLHDFYQHSDVNLAEIAKEKLEDIRIYVS